MKVKRDCIICGNSYVIDHWVLRKGRGLTCSYACGRKSAAQKFSGPRVERLKLYCQICGQLFLILPGEMRPNRKYCSRKCTNKGRFKSSLVQCAQCGKDLWRPPYRIKKNKNHYCNRSCSNLAPRDYAKKHREPTANYVEVKCGRCDKVFTISETRFKWGRGKYCSPECQYAAIKARPSKAKVECICFNCKRSFERYRSQLKRSGAGKYCSRKCRDEHRIKENHPQFINGREPRRGPNWQAQKRKAKKRDDHTCQSCGANEMLDAHHKIPFRLFDDYKKANHLSNLITLCRACHRKADARFQAQAKA